MSLLWRRHFGYIRRLNGASNVGFRFYGMAFLPFRISRSLLWQACLLGAFESARFDSDAEEEAIMGISNSSSDNGSGNAMRYAVSVQRYANANYAR